MGKRPLGQRGNGNKANDLIPIQVSGLGARRKGLSAFNGPRAYALLTAGTIPSARVASSGQHFDDTTADRNVPAQVVAYVVITSLKNRYSSCFQSSQTMRAFGETRPNHSDHTIL